MPAPLAQALGADWVTTTQSMGWASIKNGALLALAEKEFDIFITSDQNMRYQQNLSKRSIAILLVPTNRWPVLIEHIEEILKAVQSMKAKEFQMLSR
ncbi:MAG TPA: hypothetical protein VFX22_07605 [Candidatus Kapabacteria bacterium]|nr:hypothetical protein [Candidatus Kapabacteria bacterium]